MEKLITRDPATGQVLRELDMTPVEALPEIFARARAAQARWATTTPKQRAQHLLQLKEVLINRTDELIDLLMHENGKPRLEALANELVAPPPGGGGGVGHHGRSAEHKSDD